jgi:hypothetical protein
MALDRGDHARCDLVAGLRQERLALPLADLDARQQQRPRAGR